MDNDAGDILVSRWALTRLVIVALAFLSVTIALATIPGKAVNYWYLYYSPVGIAALSFGLAGALLASGAAFLSIFSFSLRLDSLARDASDVLTKNLSGPISLESIRTAVSQITSESVLRTTDGSLVTLTSVREALLQAFFGAALITLFSLSVGWLVDEGKRRQKIFALQALTDELTGLANYRSLMIRLRDEVARSKRFDHHFAFLMVDVDTLKPFNDGYGHLVGDGILRETGNALREHVRDVDLVARYGGDEFGVVLAETNHEGAIHAAERLREAVEELRIRIRDVDARVTVSIGIGIYPQDGLEVDELIEAADNALYQAKLAGKNTVILASSGARGR